MQPKGTAVQSGDQMRSSSTDTLELSTDSSLGELPLTSADGAAKVSKTGPMVEKLKKFLVDNKNTIRVLFKLVIHALIIVYFGFATNYYVSYTNSE